MVLIRSTLFNLLFYGWTALVCIVLLWTFLLPRARMLSLVLAYLRSIAFIERVVLGLRYEIAGQEHLPHTGSFVVAAKHQSAWETLKLHLILDAPAVVLKRELVKVPLWGWYASRLGVIPVDRGARGRAVASLLDGARAAVTQQRPIVIFPQGTRVAPGVYRPYRIGVAVLYEQLGLPVIPMALNSGMFWPRRRFTKQPGTIRIEFLPPLPSGLERFEAMVELERRLEAATDRLVIAEGGPATEPRTPDPAP